MGSHLSMRLRARHQVFATFHRHRPPIDGVVLLPLAARLDTRWNTLLDALKPDTIFYCAAERDENKCQAEPLRALAVNGEIPAAMANQAHHKGIRFIYFSTAKVFSGEKGEYLETDPTDPGGAYGKSKARGEEMLRECGAFVLRLGTLYGLGPVPERSLLNNLLSVAWSRGAISLINDEFRSFQSMEWIAEASEIVMDAPLHTAGLYHVSSPPKESHFSFTQALCDALEVDASHLEPVSGDTYSQANPSPFVRGRDTSFGGTAFSTTFGAHPGSTSKYLESLAKGLRMGKF